MRFQDSLILSAASAYTVAAASAPVLDGERIGRFTLELEPRAWRRETIVKRSESGDEEVVNIDDGINWATNVNLGGQDLRVQIDTGSADLWVISTGLDSETLKNNYSDNHVYDPSKSKTWSKIDTQLFNISYDVGEISASGDVGTESVNVGGATVTMRIGAATAVVGNVIDPGTDGIMGMGWAPNSIQTTDGQYANGTTFMEAVQDQLDQPVFTADFYGGRPQSLSFGFINKDLYTGDLNKVAIDNSSSFWIVDNVTFSLAGSSSTIGNSSNKNLLLDTGGLGTTVAFDVADDYWKNVQGASPLDSQPGTWTFPCTATLPGLTINFKEGSSATVPGSFLNDSDAYQGGPTCYGLLKGKDDPFNNAGFGFYASYFTVWNQADPSISFAPYSNTGDTAAKTNSDLVSSADVWIPAATGGSGGSGGSGTGGSGLTSSSKGFAAPTAAPVLGVGMGFGLLAGAMMAI